MAVMINLAIDICNVLAGNLDGVWLKDELLCSPWGSGH